jgi:Ca2+-binding EF-hand superfamily protein
LRALFLEADVDFSGFLSVMELYNIFKKLGADVTENDIIELMTEIDVDRNGELDIDEFISLMTVGD